MEILYEDLKSTSEAWKLVKPFVTSHKIRYPILMGDDEFTKSYSVTTLPITYLIDKRGRIAATYSGVVEPANLKTNICACPLG